MMSICCSKHVEAWNKYIKKERVKLVINQNHVKMHCQQNIKLLIYLTYILYYSIFFISQYFVCFNSNYVIERLFDNEKEGKAVITNTKKASGGVEV
jgi:hypothetical protein